MALWICRGCTAAYSVGAPRCPECGSTDYREDHVKEGPDDMAKITVHGGVSNAAADAEGGEPSSLEADGGTSSTSSEKDETSPETSENATPSRARTTANRSSRGRTGSSSARGTDGAPTAPTSDTTDTES